MDEHLRKAYARLRAAAQRMRSANAELNAAEREHRVALELVELLEAKGTHSAPMNSSTGTDAVIVSQEVVWEHSPTPSAEGNQK